MLGFTNRPYHAATFRQRLPASCGVCWFFYPQKQLLCCFFLTVANCWKKIITRCWNTICEISNLACSKELPYSRGILTVPYICKTAAYITFGATVCLVTCGANHFWLQRKEITIRFLWWSQRIRTLTEASLRRCGVLMRTVWLYTVCYRGGFDYIWCQVPSFKSADVMLDRC